MSEILQEWENKLGTTSDAELAGLIGVVTMTINRWRKNETKPRPFRPEPLRPHPSTSSSTTSNSGFTITAFLFFQWLPSIDLTGAILRFVEYNI